MRNAFHHCLLSILFGVAFATYSLGQSFFPVGAEAKLAGLESGNQVRGAASLLYNPANLVLSSSEEPYVEVGYAQFTQEYKSDPYDNVRIKVRTPHVTLGHVSQLHAHPGFYWGLVMYPERFGEQRIEGLPRRISDENYALDVKNYDRVFKLGLGTAYKVNSQVAVGAALIASNEIHEIHAKEVGASEDLVEVYAHNNFYRYVLGSRITLEKMSAVLSVQPEIVKTYKGRQMLLKNQTDPRLVEFEPLSIDLGFDFKFVEGWTLSVEGVHKRWSQGKNQFREGISSDSRNSDLKDVFEYSLSALYLSPWQWSIGGGYAFQPTPWGHGSYDPISGKHVIGADIARPNSVDRRTYSVVAESQMFKTVDLTFNYLTSRGERTVKDSGDRPGKYKSTMDILSAGMRWHL